MAVTLGLLLIIVGVFTSAAPMLYGALLLMVAPLGFLVAAPPPGDTHDYVADAYWRILPSS
jgi:hypothetical protein